MFQLVYSIKMPFARDFEDICEKQPLIKRKAPKDDPRIRLTGKNIYCCQRRARIRGLKEVFQIYIL